jgi:hypothetical protein
MIFTEEHPRIVYLRERATDDARRCESLLSKAFWDFISEEGDKYTFPDEEQNLERVAMMLHVLSQSDIGERVRECIAEAVGVDA